MIGKKRENKEKRLAYIRNLMETTGSTRVNASEIARMFNVSETAVRADLKEIYKEISEKEKDAVNVELVKIDSGLRRGMRELEKIIESDKQPEDKVKAIETYSRMASDYIAGKCRLGMFRPDGKGRDIPPIFCFTHGSLEDNDFIDYCKKQGHPEVKDLYDSFQKYQADMEVKAALERAERLYPREKRVAVETPVVELQEMIDKHHEDITSKAPEKRTENNPD